MGGAGGGANPEQLFAAGYAACFHSALRLVARKAKADVTGSVVEAEVGIGPNGSGGFGLTVALVVDLPAVPRGLAEQLVEQAHQVCPYSNATRGNIEVPAPSARPCGLSAAPRPRPRREDRHRDPTVRSTWPPARTAGRPPTPSASSRPTSRRRARARSWSATSSCRSTRTCGGG